MMRKFSFTFIVLTSLSACTPVKETGKFIVYNLKDSIYETTYALQDWTMTPPTGDGELQDVDPRYCYRLQTDIVCYDRLMPGMERQLVSYQGTDAPAPPQLAMRLLPKSALNESYKSENRVTSAQPVFTEIPEEKKEEPKINPETGEVELVPDTASELLPDPSISPQL